MTLRPEVNSEPSHLWYDTNNPSNTRNNMKSQIKIKNNQSFNLRNY